MVQTESGADEYLSIMREKQFSLPLFSPICIYMLKYSLFGNFKLFILILDHENMGVDALISKIVGLQETREI